MDGEYRVEDWFPHQCLVCGSASYLGAGIRKPQCSNLECYYYKAPPIEEWEEQQKALLKASEVERKGTPRDHLPDDLYMHDDED